MNLAEALSYVQEHATVLFHPDPKTGEHIYMLSYTPPDADTDNSYGVFQAYFVANRVPSEYLTLSCIPNVDWVEFKRSNEK